MGVLNKPKNIGKKALNRIFSYFECRPLRGNLPDPKIIFIIGAPRSGSTLLYQLMVNSFHLGYISNRHAPWYGALSYVEKAFNWASVDRPDVRLKSAHGVTENPYGPHECGEYWYQFFQRSPQFINRVDVSQETIRKLKNSLTRIATEFPQPFLFKNMNCALRLEVLMGAFPTAIFLVTQRDLLNNAHSLLEVRKKVYGDYERWWSMEPYNISSLRSLPAVDQVLGQIKGIHEGIDKQRRNEPKRFMDICYEDLCENPITELKKIKNFADDNLMPLSERNYSASPSVKSNEQQCRIDPDLYARLREAIKSHENR